MVWRATQLANNRRSGSPRQPHGGRNSPADPWRPGWVNAPPGDLWSVLSDDWQYATWVVGASRIREVDRDWPAGGSRIHHSFGRWPLLIDDTTEVLRSVHELGLRLKARGWPAGEAEVQLTLTPERAAFARTRQAGRAG